MGMDIYVNKSIQEAAKQAHADAVALLEEQQKTNAWLAHIASRLPESVPQDA